MTSIFGIHFGSKSRFTPTNKYEAAINKEIEDFERFKKFEGSELILRYLELNNLIHSGDFEKKIKDLKFSKYKDTEQFRQLNQYNTMRSSSDIKTYLKFVKAGHAERIKTIGSSKSYLDYEKLHTYINSSAFHSLKAKKEFKGSEAFQELQKYNSLSKTPDIKFYVKSIKSNEYKTWLKVENSDRLKTFFELEALVQSEEFLQHKASMEDHNRYKKSEEARLVDEFEKLQKNDDIKWFLDAKKNDPFSEIKKWKLTFEDDFDGMKLDNSKWMTGYYWGKALMNDIYVVEGEKQFFKEKNIELHDSSVCINTRKENTSGKTWNPQLGFITKEYNYTSGLISTGQSFRQKYGKFEAKVRFSEAAPVLNTFWMVGEKMTPQIDIFKTSDKNGKMIECGLHSINKKKEPVHQTKNIDGAKFTGDFYIYSLEWTPEAIIWKINGLEVNRETKNLPDEIMYLTFCSTLTEEPADNKIPATMEIDWIRCYEKI